MPRWILAIIAVIFLGAIIGVGALFMSTAPLQNQDRSPGSPPPRPEQPAR